MRKLLFLACSVGLCLPTFATRYYVKANASGAATGLNWVNAFTNLQEALSAVVPGDEIWVAAGQYKPTTSTTRTISFQVRNGVNMYGGFAGTETLLDQRDIASNPTVLNGDIGEPGNTTDNSHTVVTANNFTTTVTLDGFRIANGYSASGTGYNGGGLRITNTLGGEFILRQCEVVNNFSGTYGGGIYMASANLTIEDCLFNNNQGGSGSGGAIYNGNVNGSGSNLVLRDSRFKNNSARVGACLTNSQSYNTVVVDRCIFTANNSETSILVFDDFESAELRNSFLIGNVVDDFTGNVVNVNSTTSDEVFTMTNCTVAHNFNVYSNTVQTQMIRFFDTYHVIQNAIIHSNTSVDGLQVSSNADIFYSIIEGGHAGGTNIIDQDPLFASPYSGPPVSFDATMHDYTLMANSPGVNVGNNSYVLPEYDLDLALAPRIQANHVDLGCYESDFTTGFQALTEDEASLFYDASANMIRFGKDVKQNGSLAIIDLSGRRVFTEQVASKAVSLNLSQGTYIASYGTLPELKFFVP